MADSIVLYSPPEALNSMARLADVVAKHYPSISTILITSAAAAAAASPSITFLSLPNPAVPPGFTTDPVERMFEISRLNNPKLLETLQQISEKSKIRALVLDFFCNAAVEVSASLSIRTYFYSGTGASSVCAFLYFPTIHENVHENIGEMTELIEIPGCPPVFSLDFPKTCHFRQSNLYKLFLATEIDMRKSAGIIVNTFHAFEPKALGALSSGACTPNSKTPPVYCVGPLIREKSSTEDSVRHECLSWLDSQPSASVVFLCFGRWGVFTAGQVIEIANGLENTGHRFLWVVRSPPTAEGLSLRDLLPESFLERTRDRGLVVNNWAPQKEVLSHASVGAFVTHCGWSSVMEAVAFGVPMLAWPLYAEQRMNRVFLVEEIKVALPLDVGADGSVTAAEIERRVVELMGSNKGKAVRDKVDAMSAAVSAAVEKDGSSRVALEQLVHSVVAC